VFNVEKMIRAPEKKGDYGGVKIELVRYKRVSCSQWWASTKNGDRKTPKRK